MEVRCCWIIDSCTTYRMLEVLQRTMHNISVKFQECTSGHDLIVINNSMTFDIFNFCTGIQLILLQLLYYTFFFYFTSVRVISNILLFCGFLTDKVLLESHAASTLPRAIGRRYINFYYNLPSALTAVSVDWSLFSAHTMHLTYCTSFATFIENKNPRRSA